MRQPPHITSATNVSGYLCWGRHSTLGPNCSTSGNPTFYGNSGWFLIETIESYNGQRYVAGYGNYSDWFSRNAFGATNFQNTPIGAVSHVDEPGVDNANNPFIYFGFWEAGKSFGICAWASCRTPSFLAIGDPFVKK
jgi:hypothetical protein